MALVTAYIRVRPDSRRAANSVQSARQRIEAVLARAGVTDVSFPGVADPSVLAGERPRDAGVNEDGAPLDIRFDWDHAELQALWHSDAWTHAVGPVTRAPYLMIMGK